MPDKKSKRRFQSGREVLKHYIPGYIRQKEHPATVRVWEPRLSASAVAREILTDFAKKLEKIGSACG